MTSKASRRWSPVIALALLLLAWLVVKQCSPGKFEQEVRGRGLNRSPNRIEYSRHAQCRMDCRHISESEVKEILQMGRINYSKSDIGNNPECKRKYAVEGVTADQQKVRIIFAPCGPKVTVVTVIDLGKEWPCDCD